MKELHKALLKVQQELKTIHTDARGNFGNYASLEQVLEKTEEVLHKHGLLLTQSGAVDNGHNVLITTVTQVDTGQAVSSSFILTPEKPGPQGFGAAMTYFRRYSILALLGKATGDDPDAYKESQPRASSRTPAASGTHSGSLKDKPIPMFKKYSGKRYGQISMQELQASVTWLKAQSAKDSKPQSAMANEFIDDVGILTLEHDLGAEVVSDFAPPADRFDDSAVPF